VFVYTYTIWNPPVAGLRHLPYSAANPWMQSIPGCWNLETSSSEAHSSTPVAGTQTHTHKLWLPPPVAGLRTFSLFSM